MRWAHGLTYQGDFSGSCVTGQGVYCWPDGSRYQGQLLRGKRHGYGTMLFMPEMAVYQGQWKDGKRHGRGKLCWKSRPADKVVGAGGDGDDRCEEEEEEGEGEVEEKEAVLAEYDGEWCDDKKHVSE